MITFSDRLKFSRMLEDKHSIFRQFWDIGALQFSDKVKTACISFDKTGKELNFVCNKKFWDSLDDYTKVFITSHEMLHVLLNHGKRMLIHKNDENSNIAMDLVVNHMLINKFNFNRELLSFDWREYCWVDTVFEDVPPDNKSYEYYYNIIPDDVNLNLMDDHGIMSIGGEIVNDHEDILKELGENLDSSDFDDTLRGLLQDFSVGDGIGEWVDIHPPKLEIKRKWEKVLKPTSKKTVYGFNTFESWVRTNPRIQLDEDIFIPTDVTMESYFVKYEMTDVWLFLDCSGSCSKYQNRFITASKTLNAHKFNCRYFTFNTDCKEIPNSFSKIYANGGTNFKCIESSIQNIINAEAVKYPYVFVITDGETSEEVSPQFPDKWHFFLTENPKTDKIHKMSTIHRLNDFE